MKAAANGDLATAAVLLEAGADANVTIRWEHDPDPELSFAGFTAADDAALHLTGAAAAEMEALLARYGGKPANRQHPIIMRNRSATRERDTQDEAMQAMMGEMMGRGLDDPAAIRAMMQAMMSGDMPPPGMPGGPFF